MRPQPGAQANGNARHDERTPAGDFPAGQRNSRRGRARENHTTKRDGDERATATGAGFGRLPRPPPPPTRVGRINQRETAA
ncbi:MAG: hypothetical protein KIT69_09530 [Propionibacteriaceae bacterium]|nr:hypothetical protein [Propionibacteriaceae bacterium]